MPEISRFFGIIIKMYFVKGEHNPPHFHALYGKHSVQISIKTLKVIAGELPKREMVLVNAWARLNQKKLQEIWDKQKFVKIKSLE